MTIFDFNDIHSHTPGSGRVLSVDITDQEDIAKLTDGQYFTAGIHPWHADFNADFRLLSQLTESPYCVGIGECGIDMRRGPSADIQLPVLRRQLDMAQITCLPVVLHIVGALDKILFLRKEYGEKVPWIVHGFRGKVVTANQLIASGIYISLGERSNLEISKIIDSRFILRESD